MKTAAKTRYDRWSSAPVRNKSNRIVKLDDDDIIGVRSEIIEALAIHGKLTATDLATLLNRNLRHIYITLAELKANHYTGIPSEQADKRIPAIPNMNLLLIRGEKWHKQFRSNPLTPETPASRYQNHDSGTTHMIVSLDSGTRQTTDFQFLTTAQVRSHPKFLQEGNNKSDRRVIPHPRGKHILPDSDLLGIHHLPTETSRFGVIEYDNGDQRSGQTIWPTNITGYDGTSHFEKYEAYIRFIEKDGFYEKYGLPNFWLFFGFRNETRMRHSMECLASFKSKAAKRILFHKIDRNAPSGYLFTTPWQRAGFDSVSLNQP